MPKKGSRAVRMSVIGVVCGAVNGAFGGGGGLVVVPALEKFAGASVRQSHATAILVVLPVCLVSAIVYLFTVPVDFDLLVPCAVGVSAGGAVGAVALKKCDAGWISFVFALVTLLAGIRMIFP